MTFDEMPICQRCPNIAWMDCECVYKVLAQATREGRCVRQHSIVEYRNEQEPKCAAYGADGRSCVLGGIDERGNWIASYVRTKLKSMAGDAFSVSRYTADFAARAVQDRVLLDTDAVLKRILDLAALRYLRDGSSTLTQEDVEAALRSLQPPRR